MCVKQKIIEQAISVGNPYKKITARRARELGVSRAALIVEGPWSISVLDADLQLQFDMDGNKQSPLGLDFNTKLGKYELARASA